MNQKRCFRASVFIFVLACAAIARAQILPDNPNYQGIRQKETAELRAAESSMEKAELSFLHAQRRFSEVRRAVEDEKFSLVNDLLRGYTGSLQQTLSEASREIARGNNVSELFTSMQQTLSGHIPGLTDMADNAPREIRSALRQAADSARRAHDTASNWLERQARIEERGLPPGTGIPPTGVPTPDRIPPDRRPEGVPGGRAR